MESLFLGHVLMWHLRALLCQQVAFCWTTSNRSQNVPMDQLSCLGLTVWPSFSPSDQALRNVVFIVRIWSQCWDMKRGLLCNHAVNKVKCVPSLNFRVYVTCKTQIDWYMQAKGNRVVYLVSDVILWLALGFYTSALTQSDPRQTSQLTWDKAHMNSIFSHRQPKQTKTTTENACWRMQIGRKSIKKQARRQGVEMKGSSEGRRLEFSTSVTLAGLSVMCDVVEAERWSESGRVGLQARSHILQDRFVFILVFFLSGESLCFPPNFCDWMYKVLFTLSQKEFKDF